MQGFFVFVCTAIALRYNLRVIQGDSTSLTRHDETNMNKLFAVIAVVLLSGCASASKTYLNNGQQGLTIDCSGEANSWATCYEKADDSCAGTGYTIVGTDGTPSPKESEKTLGVDVGNYKSRSVVVVCK